MGTRTSTISLREHLEHVMHLWLYETQSPTLNAYSSLLVRNASAVHGSVNNLKKYSYLLSRSIESSKYFDCLTVPVFFTKIVFVGVVERYILNLSNKFLPLNIDLS